MTRKQERILAKNRQSMIAATRAIVEAGASGSTRPKSVTIACRNLAGNPLPATRLKCKQTRKA